MPTCYICDWSYRVKLQYCLNEKRICLVKLFDIQIDLLLTFLSVYWKIIQLQTCERSKANTPLVPVFNWRALLNKRHWTYFCDFFFLPSHQNRESLDFEECACLNPIYSYKNILVSTIRISIHENRNYNQPCMGLGTKNNIHSKFINEHRVLNNIKYTHSFIFFKPSSEVFLFSP